ncbi:GntR family transcriptional regulator [Cupriavidus pauculus]|jgi:DNA-binding GntR family transcriptional regulator|uniref:GntR family transcriptional regulator n=1 Tax=Cupriavidus pauculus TaxID=82633 RepID=A0A5P2HBC2_9BURK|nr:GntR family transcriptional regulator [Cupriavidus pauculus]
MPGRPINIRTDGTVRYTELANSLVKGITEGTFAIGQQLPSELALADQYDVSRTTVRAALDIVEGLGLITRRRRAGTIVCSKTTTNTYTKSVNTIEDLVNYASHTEREVLGVSNVVADEALAAALECKPGTRWMRIRMLRTEMDGDGTPLCWNDAYLEPKIGRRVAPLVPNGTGLLSQIIEQTVGVTVADIKQTIGATTIAGDMARRLLVDPGTAGLEITRTYLDDAKQAFLITVNTYPADKFRFTFWMHRTPTSA